MPNWCYNYLYVYGPCDDVTSFKQRAADEREAFALDNFIPMPKELLSAQVHGDARSGNLTPRQSAEQIHYRALYGFPDWYEWRYHHWGVKWDNLRVKVADLGSHPQALTRRGLLYFFESPWDGPLRAMTRISALFPSLLFALTYEEEFGDDFRVWWVGLSGEDTMIPLTALPRRDNPTLALKPLEQLWYRSQPETAEPTAGDTL